MIALVRCTVIALGLYVAGSGFKAIGTGNLMYLNYLRAPVAAPVAIIIGVVLIVAGLVLRR